MKTKDWLSIAFVAVGGYLAYRLWQKLQGVTAPVADVIADTYLKVVAPGDVNVRGALILPDQTALSWADLTKRSDFSTSFSGNAMLVKFGGKTYRVTARDTNGNYIAQ